MSQRDRCDTYGCMYFQWWIDFDESILFKNVFLPHGNRPRLIQIVLMIFKIYYPKVSQKRDDTN